MERHSQDSKLFERYGNSNNPRCSTWFFWNDLCNGRLLSVQFPELCSFAKDINTSVHSVFNSEDITDLFHLPLSSHAFSQYQQLVSILQDVTVQMGNDTWTYIWGSSIFTSSKAYLHLTGTRNVHLAYKWLWKSYCQPRRNFFFWLLLKDRVSTRALLRRKNIELECYSCVHCLLDTDETLLHLFFHCPFALACWNTLGMANLVQPDVFQTLTAFRDHLQKPSGLPGMIASSGTFNTLWPSASSHLERN